MTLLAPGATKIPVATVAHNADAAFSPTGGAGNMTT